MPKRAHRTRDHQSPGLCTGCLMHSVGIKACREEDPVHSPGGERQGLSGLLIFEHQCVLCAAPLLVVILLFRFFFLYSKWFFVFQTTKYRVSPLFPKEDAIKHRYCLISRPTNSALWCRTQIPRRKLKISFRK